MEHGATSAGQQPDGPPEPAARTIVPLTASGQYTQATAAPAPPVRRGLTVRAKLSLVFVALFFVFGTMLTAITYFLVRWRLNHPRADLPSWCRLSAAQKLAGEKLTVAQQLECTLAVRSDTLQQILLAALIGLLAVGLLVFAVGYWVAGRVLRPLSRVTLAARRIARGGAGSFDAGTRLAPQGPRDEMYELAETFDEMLDRLDAAFESQRRFTGNASHELRTPLAVARTLLEVALADPDTPPDTAVLAQGLLANNERSERMIEGLLALSKADRAVPAPGPVRWDEVVAGVVALGAAEAAQRGLQLRTQLNPVTVRGDATLLEQVATNLVHNALRHNLAADAGAGSTSSPTTRATTGCSWWRTAAPRSRRTWSSRSSSPSAGSGAPTRRRVPGTAGPASGSRSCARWSARTAAGSACRRVRTAGSSCGSGSRAAPSRTTSRSAAAPWRSARRSPHISTRRR